MSRNFGFHTTAAEIGGSDVAFAAAHLLVADQHSPEFLSPHLAANHDSAAENYASAGHFLDWLREGHAYEIAKIQIDDAVRAGRKPARSYLEESNGRPSTLALARVPMRYPARTANISLDNDR